MEANLITIILLIVIITVLVYMIYNKDGSSNKFAFNTTTTTGNITVPTMIDTSGNVIVQPVGYYYDGYPEGYYYDPQYWWGGWYGSGVGGNYGGRNRHWGNHHGGGHRGMHSGGHH